MNQNKRVMVLLVGGRLTPNFIGVQGYHPSIVECLVSKDEQNKYDDVKEVLSPLPNIELSEPKIVPAFDMQKAMDACQEIIDAHPEHEIIFNVTAATKIMGIAAYEIAKRNQKQAIYVDTANGQFINLYPLNKPPLPIQKINLEEYLQFYGRYPRTTFDFSLLSISKEKAIETAIYLAETKLLAVDVLSILKQNNRGNGKRTIKVKIKSPLEKEQWMVFEKLNQIGILSKLTKNSDIEFSYVIANDHDWNFLNGTWLEVYVWYKAKNCLDKSGQLLFDDCNFSFEIPTSDGTRKEIDVGCMYQGQLIHSSCKSENKSFKTAYLDELRSVSSLLGGRFCSRIFVTNIYPPSKNSGGWRDYQAFCEQAKQRNIVVVTGDNLAEIGEILKKEATKPTYWRV